MPDPAPTPCRLEAVDELCRLALIAGRLGCRVLLVDVDPGLRELLLLAGVSDVLLEAPVERTDLP